MGIRLSACTIAKNEALNIGKSIDSYKDYVDEIIIVDTGSIDETAAISEEKGAKVLKFEWKNDFAAAKNFALDNATGDWVIFLDADEWFDGDTAKNIRDAIENAKQLNYNAIACKLVNFFTETEVMETASTIRIFKNSENIRFRRAIHEALFDISADIPLPGIYTEILTINHSGYMKGLLAKKAKRNKALLDKNFALGNATPIDYFYGLRENLQENPKVSEYFYKLIENTSDYDESVSSFNINTSVDENKIKLVNLLADKYPFDYRVKLLEDIQKKHENNPTFKFFEYLLFDGTDKKRAIKALEDAVEFDKTFEKDNAVSNNAFYGKRSEACEVLGSYYMFANDEIKALDYFTRAVKADSQNLNALLGILHIISNEKTEDKVIFINSIFDISNKDTEKFLVDALRLTEYKEVFLYYFVDYYKKYEEVDRAFFTSRLLTENFSEIADKYVNVYKESKDERALVLVIAALIAGNCTEKFPEIAVVLPVSHSKILAAYFEDKDEGKISDAEFQIIFNVFREIAYVVDSECIKRLVDISGDFKERLISEMIKYYYSKLSYEYVLKRITEFKNETYLSDAFRIYSNYLTTVIYFTNGEFDKLSDCLDKVVSDGFLESKIVLICEMLEADDEKLQEYFELFSDLNFAKINAVSDEIKDSPSDAIKFMTVEKFEEEMKSKSISLFGEHAKVIFDFAEKAKSKKAFSIAEKYYKISVKYGYKKDKAYFALGDIYNCFEKPELSFYCYENAFIENFTLAEEILPKGHANCGYVFSRKKEFDIDKCPVCGGESKILKTYINIFDEKLSYNEPLIVKYRSCNVCGHVFSGNDIVNKNHWEKESKKVSSDTAISLAYDILENICEITDGNTVLDCSEDNGEFKTAAENYGFRVSEEAGGNVFDIIFAGNSLNGGYDLEERLERYVGSMAENGIIVFEFFDEGNAFSKLADRPYWVRAGVKNVFSKNSVNVLFDKFDLHILQINVDKINKGKILVFAGK